MQKLRKNGSKIVPRILFDQWMAKDYVKLFTESSRIGQITKLLVDLCISHEFDGLTLEVWNQLGGQARPELRRVISDLSDGLKKAGKLGKKNSLAVLQKFSGNLLVVFQVFR